VFPFDIHFFLNHYEFGKSLHLRTNMKEIAFSISYCDQKKRVYIK